MKEGYDGKDCEFELKPCEDQCKNNGLCKTYQNGTTECACQGNYTGERCNQFKTCSNETCSNNGNCVFDSLSNSYSCLCKCECITNL